MGPANASTMEPELRSMLGRHREELLRRALALAISRSTLDDLELLFEAAATPDHPTGGDRTARNRDLRSELNHQLEEHRREGRIFSVAVVTAGRARVAR